MSDTPRWIVGGLLSAALVAIISYPSPDDDSYLIAYHDTRELHMARAQWIARSELWRREDGAQVARAAVAMPGRADQPYEIVRPKGVPDRMIETLQKNADRALAGMTAFDSTIRVVVTVALDSQGDAREDSIHRGYWAYSTDVYLPPAVGDNACVVVVRAEPRFANRQFWVPFGPCYWFKAYGRPGRGVTAWLDSTRNTPLWADRAQEYFEDPDRQMDVARYPTILRCVDGDAARCLSLLLGAQSPSGDLEAELRTPHWLGWGRISGMHNDGNRLADWLLVRLEDDLPRTAFAKIWNSDSPVPAAFQEATGRPLDGWIRAQIAPFATVRSTGPIPTGASWFAFGIIVPTLIAAGVYGGSKRVTTG